ncbi:hypothetical protein A7982_13929 [Minicystis rosea]|nr:hypothetical protein A7982_13929 [Minicystis rosea]
MKTLFDGPFQTLAWDEGGSLLVVRDKPASAHMTRADFEEHALRYAGALDDWRPRRVLVDARESGFEADEATSVWIDQHVFPHEAAVLARKAYVMSPSFLDEQDVDPEVAEELDLPFRTAILTSERAALDWLFTED